MKKHSLLYIVPTYLFILLALPNLLIAADTNTSETNTREEWYPFHFPEKISEDMFPNIGKLVLDAPAGKHGFNTVKDGHFYFEDGTRAKFWGTNLCFNACFPTKKQAEMLADRIAYFGFNAVRLHHMDSSFEPRGIFEDVCPAYKDPQMKKTGVLSKKQLDRLDYLIYCLKERGIYIDMNLLVSRHFTEADGVPNAGELDKAGKPASLFDAHLIELQKDYIRNLMTHYNPYTKLKYNEDPVIALVEITNENSLLKKWEEDNLNGTFFGLRKKGLPSYYQKQLDTLWNTWLLNKYGSLKALRTAWHKNTAHNSHHSEQPIVTSWNLEQTHGAQATLLPDRDRQETTITIDKTTNTSWHIQYACKNISLSPNKKYQLSLTARSSKPSTISVGCQKAYSPWTNLGLSEQIQLEQTSQTIFVPFTVTESCDNAKIALILGKNTSITYTVSNITLREIDSLPLITQNKEFSISRPLCRFQALYPQQAIADIKECYKDIEKKYMDTMYLFVKKELNMRVPITGMGGISALEDILAQESVDYIDAHTYWDAPQFPHKPWDKHDFLQFNNSMLQDPQFGILGRITDRYLMSLSFKEKPFTVTEWNHCYPNQYAYETPILFAAKAYQEQWDSLFQFAFSHGWADKPDLNNISNYFDTIANPQKLMLSALGSYIYLRNETPTIDITNDMYTISTPTLKAFIGTIKDKLLTTDYLSVTAHENGALIILSSDMEVLSKTKGLALIAIGDVKNTGSRLTNDRFDWGTSPILMQRTPITINTTQNKIIILPKYNKIHTTTSY